MDSELLPDSGLPTNSKSIEVILVEYELALRSNPESNLDDFVRKLDDESQGAELRDRLVQLQKQYHKTETAESGPNWQISHSDQQEVSDAAPKATQATGFRANDKLYKYVIERPLGAGAFGTVYLAKDPVANREVAIKVIRQSPNRPQGAEADSTAEARANAAVRHDRVVRLLDHGELANGAGAYLVFEHIAGMTLAEYMATRPLSYRRAAEILSEIAEAVAAIHAKNLTHRDLKPANILLDQKERAFVADFGLAITEEAQRQIKRSAAGTPPYMSPEQLEGDLEVVDGRTDIWAMGVMLYQMLTGHMPFSSERLIQRGHFRPPSQRNPDVPHGLDEICCKCLALKIEDRYVSATALLRDLRAFINGSHSVDDTAVEKSESSSDPLGPATVQFSDTLPPPLGSNPYRGLSAFNQDESHLFFGREQQVDRVLNRLQALYAGLEECKTRIVPVLGPSGCGKSSLVRAGVLVRLLQDPNRVGGLFCPVIFTPEARPLESMANALARAATTDPLPIGKSEEFHQSLRRKSDDGSFEALRRLADMFAAEHLSRIILVIDQFEELLLPAVPVAEREAFIGNLLCAARDKSGNLGVLLTLRSDFLVETQKYSALDHILADNGILIPSMSDEELRSAIVMPARAAGYEFDAGIVELLIRDTLDREGALPLLQFALTRIWDGLLNDIPPSETLRQAGGVGGALAGVAQGILDTLTPEEQALARRVFLGLVHLGEGAQDTRRRVHVGQLPSNQDTRECLQKVLQRFSSPAARLVTLSADPFHRDETAELTHEALIQHWQQLRDWLDEGRDRIRFLRRLDEAIAHWEELGRPTGLLWRSPDLDLLQRFDREHHVEMTKSQIDFYRKCRSYARLRRAIKSGVAVAFLVAITFWIRWLWRQNEIDNLNREILNRLTVMEKYIGEPDSVEAWREEVNEIKRKLDYVNNLGDQSLQLVVRQKLEDSYVLQSRLYLDRPLFSLEADAQESIAQLLQDFQQAFPLSPKVREIEEQLKLRTSEEVRENLLGQLTAAPSGTFINTTFGSSLDLHAELSRVRSQAGTISFVFREKFSKVIRYVFRVEPAMTPQDINVYTATIQVGTRGAFARSVHFTWLATLSLSIARRGEEIRFSVADQNLEYHEMFSDLETPLTLEISYSPKTTFESLSVSYYPPTEIRSPMGDADALVRDGKLSESATRYAVIRERSNSPEVVAECQIKEAIVNGRLRKNDKDSLRQLQEIAFSRQIPWSVVAATEILRRAVETEDIVLTEVAHSVLTVMPPEQVSSFINPSVWTMLNDRIKRHVSMPGALRLTQERLKHLETLGLVMSQFGPPIYKQETFYFLARANAFRGMEGRVDELLRNLISERARLSPALWQKSLHEFAWCCVRRKIPNDAVPFLFDAAASPIVTAAERAAIQIDLARLLLAMQDETRARAILQKIIDTKVDASAACEAYLLIGFLDQANNNADKAIKAWQAGYRLAGTLPPAHVTKLLLGSLSDELTPDEVKASFLQNLSQSGEEFAAAKLLINSLITRGMPEMPLAVRQMFQDKRGKVFAERMARREIGYDESFVAQAVLGMYHTIRLGAFSDPLDKELDQFVWKLANDGAQAWRTGELTDGDLGIILTAWWRLLGPTTGFKVNTEFKARLACIYGYRYMKEGDRDQAKKSFEAAAGFNDAGDELKRLAQRGLTELNQTKPNP